MGSEILPAARSWAGWRWVAVGLATAVALGRLAALIAGVSSTPSNSPFSVFFLAWLVELAVVATGVWLAAQRHRRRIPLGLAVLATASALGPGGAPRGCEWVLSNVSP